MPGKAKTQTLLLIAIAIVVFSIQAVVGIPQHGSVGIYLGSPLYTRATYHFFHASVIHLFVNASCLLALAFNYHITTSQLITSAIIASLVPPCCLSTIPSIGLSGICFALMGMQSFSVQRKLYYQAYILSFLAIGFVLPWICRVCGLIVATPNNFLHLYCYVAGLLVGLITTPLPW